jgi:hypothetical protein
MYQLAQSVSCLRCKKGPGEGLCTMGDILSEVQRWRAKADEARATAEMMSNAVARDSLLEMADRYERLAAHMKKLHAKRRARQKRP